MEADLFNDTEGHVVAGVDEVGRGPLAGAAGEGLV